VRDATIRGEIYIESGIIVHASAGDLQGPKAFYKLLSLTRGLFHLQAFKAPAEKTVEGSWEFLLIEAARVRDEEKQISVSAETIHVAKRTLPDAPATPPTQSSGEEELVVVSTYDDDGTWHPVDSPK
jgi:hypothetical protein